MINKLITNLFEKCIKGQERRERFAVGYFNI
jgi:hypothetical protein